VGILALGYCGMGYFDGWLSQVKENRAFQQNLGQRPATAKAAPEPSAVLGRLQIPSLGVSVMVVEGANDTNLEKGAGHIPGTALPGEAGNVGIAAHRDTFFRPLRRIQRNDLVILSTIQGDYRYRVATTNVVSPEVTQVLYPTANDGLTLVTCFPLDYIGAAPKRFIVRAGRVQE
jgi:sortase A